MYARMYVRGTVRKARNDPPWRPGNDRVFLRHHHGLLLQLAFLLLPRPGMEAAHP